MIGAEVPLSGVDRLLVAVQDLSLAHTLEEIVDICRHAARDLCGADGATFILREDDQCYYVDEDAISPLWSGQRFPMDTCISGWVMLNAQSVAVRDIYADDRIPQEAYRPTFVTSLAMVPIRSRDPIGAIGNYWAEEHQATDDEVRLLQALADSASVAIASVSAYAELAESRMRATTDELTGLLNRRGFALQAQATLDAARTAGRNALVAFIDVDRLKETNDRNGHDAGDALLRSVADALAGLAREGDLVARLGGDEFCALAIDLPVDGGYVYDRLARALAERGASASVGWVEVGPESPLSVVQLINLADARMYADKAVRSRMEP